MSVTFGYAARDAGGGFVAGVLNAPSEREAFELLHMRRLTVTALERRRSARGAAWHVLTLTGPSTASRIRFFRTTAAMVRAGVSLRRALAVSVEQTARSNAREVFAGLAADVEAGVPLSEAFSRRPAVFSAVQCAIVRAGESGGTLDAALARVASLLERANGLRKRTAAALAYPAVVSAIAMALVLFLVGSVVPTLTGLLGETGEALPPLTRAVMSVGRALLSPAFWMALVILASAVAFAGVRLRASDVPRAFAERVVLRLPVLGALVRKAETSACARLLGTLLQSGLPVVTALELARAAARSRLHRKALAAVAQCVALGQSLTAGFAASGWHEPMFVAMVRAGEESGELGEMLLRAADYDETDVETALTGLSSVLEPVMILFLGGVVGTIVAAVLIPLYSVIGSVR